MTKKAAEHVMEQEALPIAPETQVATIERAGAVQQPTVLEIFCALARDKSIEVSRIRELMEMQERAEEREAKKAFAVAMRNAQAEMVPIVRNAENAHTKSKYATLEIIDAAIRPIYTKHGFSLTFNSPTADDKGVLMTCTALHNLGHSEPYSLHGELDMSGPQGKANKTPIQGLSSSVTYLQRILTRMIFNLVFSNEDKDGNGDLAFIDEQQTNNIIDMMAAAEMGPDSQSKFLTFMHAERVSEIHKRDYEKAVTALNAKIRKRQQAM
jgi:ERF superfamily